MRRLLGIICLFRGHRPKPCRGPSDLYRYYRCQRCGTVCSHFRDDIKIEWVEDDVWHRESPWNRPLPPTERGDVLTRETLDDLLQEIWDAGAARR